LLDIGLDTLVFIDDQAFERAEVNETLEVVTVLAETEVDRLLDNPLFDVPVTKESIGRRLMYRDEEVRRATFLGTPGADYATFLRSCNITLDVRRLRKDDVDRIYELSQRTNQLNVSGTRYERDQVAEILTDQNRVGLVLRCSDRFGDYGIIGFVSVVPDRTEVEDFFMSCRVQRKRVEHALFQHLSDILEAQGAQSIRVRFRSTKRNAAALELFKDLGFELQNSDQGVGYLARRLRPIPDADIVSVTAEPGYAEAAE
jgi:FkbH-like protein